MVDGGSLDHGTENRGYGSYQLSNRDGRQLTIRLDLGTATNNEAEYQTLIAALKDLVGRIQRAGKNPSDYSLLVHTDSQLMVGQLMLSWQVKAANPSAPLRTSLRSLVDEAATLIRTFGRCDLVKVPGLKLCACSATDREPDPFTGIGLAFFPSRLHLDPCRHTNTYLFPG